MARNLLFYCERFGERFQDVIDSLEQRKVLADDTVTRAGMIQELVMIDADARITYLYRLILFLFLYFLYFYILTCVLLCLHNNNVETLEPINESAVDFLRELGRRISSKFQDVRQTAYLFQRLSVTVQRYNAVILHDSFPPDSDLWPPME